MNSSAKKNSFRLSTLVIGTLASQAAIAQGFSAVELSSGYQLPASADPVKTDATTTAPVSTDKSTEHKCGEGKCGEAKPADAKTEVKSTKEAKCGGMI